MWAAIAQAGISIVTNVMKRKAEMEAKLSEAKYKRGRLEVAMNRDLEIRGANYVKVRQQALADTHSITEAGDGARSEADTDMAFSNIRGISRNDIDRQIARDMANSQLQANREATEKIQHLDMAGKQTMTNFEHEASMVGADTGKMTVTEGVGMLADAGSAFLGQYSRDFHSLTKR